MSLIRIIIQEFPWRKMKEHVLHISDLEYRSCNYHLSTKLQHVIVESSYKKILKICVLKKYGGSIACAVPTKIKYRYKINSVEKFMGIYFPLLFLYLFPGERSRCYVLKHEVHYLFRQVSHPFLVVKANRL